jgi:hypothetical protein
MAHYLDKNPERGAVDISRAMTIGHNISGSSTMLLSKTETPGHSILGQPE